MQLNYGDVAMVGICPWDGNKNWKEDTKDSFKDMLRKFSPDGRGAGYVSILVSSTRSHAENSSIHHCCIEQLVSDATDYHRCCT